MALWGFSAARAKQTPIDTPEFRAWFGNSVVVNEDGSPRVMFHGTRANVAFTEFAVPTSELGIHVGTERQAGQFVERNRNTKATVVGRRIYPLYVSIQNALRLPDTGSWEASAIYGNRLAAPKLVKAGVLTRTRIREYGEELRGLIRLRHRYKLTTLKTKSARKRAEAESLMAEVQGEIDELQLYEIQHLRKALRAAGYDGIVYENTNEGTYLTDEEWDALVKVRKAQGKATSYRHGKLGRRDSYIVWNPGQLKSAIGNRGTWDMRDPDILHGIGFGGLHLR